MNTSTPKPDPGAKAPPMMHEGDIGCGDISPGQHETNEMIKEIPPLHGHVPSNEPAADKPKGGSSQS